MALTAKNGMVFNIQQLLILSSWMNPTHPGYLYFCSMRNQPMAYLYSSTIRQPILIILWSFKTWQFFNSLKTGFHVSCICPHTDTSKEMMKDFENVYLPWHVKPEDSNWNNYWAMSFNIAKSLIEMWKVLTPGFKLIIFNCGLKDSKDPLKFQNYDIRCISV